MKTVEVFSIGDELLRGIVADTNSHWMAKRIAARGASLTRIAVVGDDPPVAAEELRGALERVPALIVTHGGLGPTDDDRTREAVSLATGRALEPDAAALTIVRARYESLAAEGRIPSAELDDARLRMSVLPFGAIALDNQVGGAPGILLEISGTAIVCLPGVPQELWWIWEHSLVSHLDRLLGPGGFTEITVTLSEHDESRLAEMVRGIAARHPRVYVKSRATAFDEPDPRVRLTLAASGSSDVEARALAEAAFKDATDALTMMGISVEERAISSSIGRKAEM